MANLHLSAGGSNTSPFDTWAKAATSIASALAAMADGDTLYIDKAYAESQTGYNLTIPGTTTNPCRLISGTPDSGSGLTNVERGATFTATGTSGSYWQGNVAAYGLKFVTNSTSTVEMRLNNAAGIAVFDDCEFTIGSTAGGSAIHQLKIGGTAATAYTHVQFRNCTFRYASSNTATRMSLEGRVEFFGGGFANDTSSTPSRVAAIGQSNDGTHITFTGFDFSPLSSTVKLIYTNAVAANVVTFLRCKMPSGWDPEASFYETSNVPVGCEWNLINCSGASGENWRTHAARSGGLARHATEQVKSGGTTDGTTAYSLKITANDRATVADPLYTPWDSRWLDSVGAAKQLEFELLHDSATALTNKQVWVEVDALNVANYPQGSLISAEASPLAAGTAHGSSSVTWPNSGSMSNPNKQKLVSPSFTPQVKGLVRWRIGMAGTGAKTLYVDPQGALA